MTNIPDNRISFSERYGIFAKRTTFHGFRDVLDSKTWWQKLFWVAVILIFAAFLLLFILLQTTQYLDGNKATRVTRLAEDSPKVFPMVWVAHQPFSWIDTSKVRRFGITPEELLVALAHVVHN